MKSATLEEVSTVVSKGTTPTTLGHGFLSKGVPFLRAEDVTGGSVNPGEVAYRISEETNSALSRSQLQPGDLLITIAGTLGRVGYLPRSAPPMNCNQAVAFIRLRPEVIDLNYACLACQAKIGHLLKLQKIGTIGNLNLEQVRGFRIPLPSLDEQKRVATQLERVNRLRRNRNYVYQISDNFVQAIFFEMFDDPVTNPQGWKTVELGDLVAEFEGGVNFNPVSEGEPSSPWRVLKISSVTSGEFKPLESKPIRPDTTFHDSLVVRKGDLIISRANTTELVGAVSMVRQTPPKLLLPDKLWRIKLRQNAPADSGYLLHFLQLPHSRKIIGELATGTSGSMKNISKEKAGTIPILLPPTERQEQFIAVMRRVERLRAQQREADRQAENLFQTLLRRAFSETDSPTAEVETVEAVL